MVKDTSRLRLLKRRCILLSDAARESKGGPETSRKDLEAVGSEKPRINMEVPILIISTRGINNNADSSRPCFHDGIALAGHSKRHSGTANSKHLIPCS